MDVANGIGVSVTTLLLLLLAGKADKRNHDYALVVLALSIGGFFLANIWVAYGLTPLSYFFLELSTATLVTPLVIYTLLLISPEHTFRTAWLGFAWLDVVFVVYLAIDLGFTDRLITMTVDDIYRDPPLLYLLYHKLHKVYVIGVLLWLLLRLRRYQKQIQEVYSNTEDVQLDWLKAFLYTYLITVAINQAFFVPYNLGYIESVELPYLVTNSAFAIMMFYMIYHGLKQQVVAILPHVPFADRKSVPKSERGLDQLAEDNPTKNKYQSSSLSESAMVRLFEDLKGLFERDALYLRPELKVQDVAAQLKITTHNVSQILNVKAGKSFYEFVNGYRVAHLQGLLIAPDKGHYTILALAIESGFNSKATLNRVFKKRTGMTPRQYRQHQQGAA